MDFKLIYLSCLCSKPVSIIEEARIDSLPYIPKRTLGIEDPPEKKQGLRITITSFLNKISQVYLQEDQFIISSQGGK